MLLIEDQEKPRYFSQNPVNFERTITTNFLLEESFTDIKRKNQEYNSLSQFYGNAGGEKEGFI